MNKTDLRKKARQILTSFSSETVKINSLAISKNLTSIVQELYSNHQANPVINLGAYSPLQKEVLWYLNFEQGNFSFSVPHLYNESEMDFFKVSLDEIKNDSLGLELESKHLNQKETPEVLFIPGLAFTKEGKRLGRGKGFYDRYLMSFKGIKIGVCFESQLFEEIETEEHDQVMDIIITEKNIYK